MEDVDKQIIRRIRNLVTVETKGATKGHTTREVRLETYVNPVPTLGQRVKSEGNLATVET